MTRTVLSNDMVAHVWAQQNQEHGRSSNGNFYFRGPTIYSYRDGYPIGHFVQCPDGKPAVLLWDGSYSVTTSSHQRMAEGAVRHLRSFKVPDVLASDYRGDDLEARAEKNVGALNDALKASIDELMKSARNRAMNSRLYMLEHGMLNRQAEAVREYCKAFRLKCPQPARDYSDDAQRAAYEAAAAEAHTAAERKRERRLARFNGDREAMKAHDERQALIGRANRIKSFSRWPDWRERRRLDELASEIAEAHERAPDDETIARHHQRFVAWREEQARISAEVQERVERHRLERAREAALTAERKAQFETLGPLQQRDACIAGEALWTWLNPEARNDAWREGLPVPRHALPYERTAKLRVRGETVETSQGATFPAEHARKAWRVLRLLFARGEAWQANGHSIKLGHFAISSVSADGTITAGCHLVSRAEAERLAAALGLPPVPDIAGDVSPADWQAVSLSANT